MKQIILLIVLAVFLCGCQAPELRNSIKDSDIKVGGGEIDNSFFYELELLSYTQWALVIKNSKDEIILATPEMMISGEVSLKVIITEKPQKQISIVVENKNDKIEVSHDLTGFPGEVVQNCRVTGKKHLDEPEEEIGKISFVTWKEMNRLKKINSQDQDPSYIEHLKLIIRIKPSNTNEPAK